MKEFGSDFHYIESYNSGRAHLTDVFRGAMLLADGRQCIVVLIRQNGWKRLWMPDYFCYEVIETIKEQTGIDVILYEDNPLKEESVDQLPFEKGDVLLRMNFFGMRDLRSNKNIPIPVIEDHSHDPFGHWALYSDADWCISSIRKSLPLPEGGMMWSPKQLRVEGLELRESEENEKMAAIRWEGMEMKAAYLSGKEVSKDEFRKKYTETEEWFDTAEPTLIDERTKQFISKQFDLNLWLGAKRKNWALLSRLVNKENCEVLTAEHESCTMFSLVLLLEGKERRDALRKDLIDKCVYPAILWKVPESASEESKRFSERMLSIHCDGRYNEEDIKQLADILNKSLE
jgi:hypothetical protein